MNLEYLRYFVAVARGGSITAAARALQLSQPSLSVAMRNLEESLGARLLVRTRAGVEPTAAGLLLLERAEQLLALAQDTVEQVRDVEDGERGAFVLGCHDSLGAYFLPGFLAGFLATHPRIDLTLWSGHSAAVRDAVVAREISFGLVVNCEPHPTLVILPLLTDEICFFVAARRVPHAASWLTSTWWEADALSELRLQLRAATLLWCDRPVFRQLIDTLSEQDLAPRRQLVCGDLELVKSLCRAGIGIGVLPRRVAAYGAEGELVPLHEDLPRHQDTISLVFHADLPRTGAMRMVKDALLAYGRHLEREPLR